MDPRRPPAQRGVQSENVRSVWPARREEEVAACPL